MRIGHRLGELSGNWRVGVALVVSLVVLFWPGFLEHMQHSADPLEFSDDVRQQIVPFLLEASVGEGGLDFVSTYYLDCMPRGYSQLIRSTRPLADPRIVSKVLPYILFAGVLFCVGLAARDLGGTAALWGSLALCLGASVFFSRMTGGVPRAFAFPLVALIALALVRGRPTWIAISTLCGALFYYPVAVLGGLVLLLETLLAARTAGQRRRWGLVVGTGVLTILLVLPVVMAVRAYGPALGPADVAQYPEVGPGGRFKGPDLAGEYDLAQHLGLTVSKTFIGDEENAFLPGSHEFFTRNHEVAGWILLALVALACVPLVRTSEGMRRLLILPVAALLAWAVAELMTPRLFLPGRYIAYGLPLFCCLALPAGLVAAARTVGARGHAPSIISVALTSAIILAMGSRGPGILGSSISITGDRATMIEEIARLPEGVMLAGWPFGVINNAPYLASRPALINHETHLPLHAVYADEMRRRTSAVIEAYFAKDPGPLVSLRDRFGVTHLVVDRRHYAEKTPRYFKPFDVEIAAALSALDGEPEAVRQTPHAAVAEHGPYILLDLARIERPPQ